MIVDQLAFADHVVPQRLLHRGPAVEQLLHALDPGREGDRAGDVLVSGPSGVGKTSLARFSLRRLQQRRLGVEHAYVRCLGLSTADVLREVLSAHPAATADAITDDHDTLQTALSEVVEGGFVAVLDEADHCPRAGTIDALAGVRGLSVVAICHDPREWRAALPTDLAGRFDGRHALELDRYGAGELADILERRVRQGLRGEPIDRVQLEWIADDVHGVARDGIQTVRAAAELAGERGHDHVRDQDVEDGFEHAQESIRKQALESLPHHHRVLYAIVYQHGPVTAGDFHERYETLDDAVYEETTDTPVSKRRRREFLGKLETYGLVECAGETRGRVYRVADRRVKPPSDLAVAV